MKLPGALASIIVFVSLLAATPAHPQASDPVPYALASPPSQFEWGCFGPCACPVLIRSPLTGTFVLRQSQVDPLYTYYDVLDVRWQVPDATQPVAITGSGTYRRGGEFALMEQLTLDLSFNSGPLQHFDSGLNPPTAPFPEIHTRASLHGEACHDSVVEVDAKPSSVSGVGDRPQAASLTAAPNPFTGATEIGFVMPRAGTADLGIYDLAGRRVRSLIGHEWLGSGAHTRAWDGQLDGRVAAPPGLYLVRLDTPMKRMTRTVAKVR